MPDLIEGAELTTEQPWPQEASPDSREGRPQFRILLAEDSPTNQLLATMNLEQAGYLVEAVNNGRKAVQVLDEGSFDLVLMDVFMPEMNGLEATRIIRQSERGSGRHIPIIAMSGTDTQKHREECLAAGMDGFVSKPVTPCELHGTIALLLPQDRDSLVEGSQAPENPRSTPSVDLEESLRVVDGDTDLLRHVVEMFLEEYESQMEALRDALARQDAMGVESAAYKLKGVLGNVGGSVARDLAYQLETMGEQSKLDGGGDVLKTLEAEMASVVTFYSTPGWDQGVFGGEVG